MTAYLTSVAAYFSCTRPDCWLVRHGISRQILANRNQSRSARTATEPTPPARAKSSINTGIRLRTARCVTTRLRTRGLQPTSRRIPFFGQLEGVRVASPVGVNPFGDPGSPSQAGQQGPDIGQLDKFPLQRTEEPAAGVDSQGSTRGRPRPLPTGGTHPKRNPRLGSSRWLRPGLRRLCCHQPSDWERRLSRRPKQARCSTQ